MINELTIDLAHYRLAKAKDLLEQAQLLYSNEKYDGSINRSYYAIFNAIRSILALIELDSSKHSGVIAYFDRYLVKNNIFDKEYSKIVHQAFDTRQENDYEDFYEPSEQDAKIQIENANRFISRVIVNLEKFISKEVDLPLIEF